MERSHLLQGKKDSFDGLLKSSLAELPKMRHEEGPKGGDSGKKKLCDDHKNTCGLVIWSKNIFLVRSARNLGES